MERAKLLLKTRLPEKATLFQATIIPPEAPMEGRN